MKHDELINRFEELLKNNTRTFFDADEFEILIDYYLTTSQYHKALKASDFALEQYPYSIDFLIRKAQMLSANKETRKALELLTQAEAIDPIHPEIFMTRGSIYSLTGLPEEAIKYFKKAIEHAEGSKEIIEDGYLYLAFE